MAFERKPQSIGTVLQKVLQSLPHQKKVKRGMVLHYWPEVVGEQIAAATRELRFEGDRLVVYVDHTAWRHEIHMNRVTIRKKLNEKVGSEVVKELVVRS